MSSDKLSEADLAAALADGAAAQVEFHETLRALIATVTSVDQVEILARLAFSLGMSEKARDLEGKGLEVFHVEILQALALSKPRNLASPGGNYADVTQSSIDLIEQNGIAYRRLSNLKMSENIIANQRQELVALVQFWTLAVRGPRHLHQTQEYCNEIATAIDMSFRHHIGCSSVAVLNMLENIVRVIGQRLTVHLDKLRNWMQKKSGPAMVEAFVRDLTPDEAAHVTTATLSFQKDRKSVNAYLWNESEAQFATIFAFSFEELLPSAHLNERACLRAVLESLSIAFGDMTVESLQHVHLNNPVRLKPFIKLDEECFFCFNPQSLSTNFSEVFQEICLTKPSLKERLEGARAAWLEAKLGCLVRKYLPHAETHSGVRWIDPNNGKNWESDVVVMIDKTILIFEAKSAKISSPARRGAINSLKTALKDLVVDPSEQSLRLKRHIETASQELHLKSNEGTLVIDPAKVRDIIRVNILLDAIGPLSAHWPQMKAAGFVPENSNIAPSMSVFELETVFEVLSHEVERCHYLSRRAEFERNATYTADELDLLAFYVETQFNVGNKEFDGSDFKLYGLSLRLAVGYSERREAGKLRFELRRTELWKRLLASLEEKRPEGWTRFAHRLLNVDLESQKLFERVVKRGWKKLRREPSHFFTSGVTVGEEERKQTIAFAMGTSGSSEQFSLKLHQASRAAFEQGGATSLLLIYWFTPATGQAYDFIGVMRQI